MRKTVFVHIGAPAAGGSFLQRRLEENRPTLRGEGIAVLDSLAALRRRGDLMVDCATVVVSNPLLAGAPVRRVARVLGMLADEHIQLIYALPDLGAALVAEWQRHVLATARTVSPATWIKELASGEHPSFWRTYGLRDVFGRWSMPPADVHVVIAPSGSDRDGELWTRFASVLGAPAAEADEGSAVEEPLGPEELELLRRVHARMRDAGAAPGAYDVARQAVAGETPALRDRSRWPPLPLEHRSWIDHQTAVQRAWLESSGFDVVGPLDDLELDEHRFDPDEALADEERLLARGVDVSAALVEGLVRRREQGARIGRRDGRTDGAGPPTVRGIVRRTGGLVSSLRAAVPAGMRRRGRSSPVRSARPTFYLHIGAPKCGSSYLQSLLWKNRGALMRDGVYVPGRSQADHFWAGTDFRGRPYVTQAPGDPWRGAWDRLIDDAERAGCPKIVISSEFLDGSRAEEISARLDRLGEADVHVIYVVRELAGLLGSVWQQGVQVGPAVPWAEWLEAVAQDRGGRSMWSRHDGGKICARWAANGADELDVLVLPRSGSASDELWRRFQSIVGWSVRTRVDADRANESLGYSQAEFLRRLQHRLVDVEPRHQRARVTKNLIASQVLRRMERVDALVIPEHLRAWLESESAKQRDLLVASGARIVGDLDDLRVVDSRFSRDPPEPGAAVMVDAAVHVIERLAVVVARAARSAPAGS